MTKTLPLSQGKVALIDDEDYERLCYMRWYANKIGNTYYAVKNLRGKQILMHRIIMNAPEGMEVDHIDHNGLNNQKSNLRIVTHKVNMQNRVEPNVRKPYNGRVHPGIYYRKPWSATIPLNGKRKFLGSFDTEEEAISVQSLAMLQYHGSDQT